MATRAARAALFILGCLLGACGLAQPLTVVTSTTDLKSLVEIVSGDRAAVASIVPAGSNAEEYQPRPGDLGRLKDARLVVRVGADYDLWLDALLRRAGNPALVRGGPGYVDASFGIALLEVRGEAVDAQGHAHGSGNPHYWLDPANAAIITGFVLEALARVDPPSAKYYEARRLAFLERLAAKLHEWAAALAPVQGRPMLAYHNSWAYLARRFRLNVAGTIEPRVGVPPSAAHLAALLRKMSDEKIEVIVRQPFEPEKTPTFLAAKAGARVVVLAASVGAVPQASDYLALFDYNVKQLATAWPTR